MLYHPNEDPIFATFIYRKLYEIQLLRLGFSRDEVKSMTPEDIQLVKHLLSYLEKTSKHSGENYA